ncbi:hypothetical protein PDR5_45650 [Pseudomonas sp. DR 5-09]|nr:hypothetical protein PDR5_45650 [Pseudomonas sp. DR 5-09]
MGLAPYHEASFHCVLHRGNPRGSGVQHRPQILEFTNAFFSLLSDALQRASQQLCFSCQSCSFDQSL